MTEQTVGTRIARLRVTVGMTGEQLGEALGLTKSQVSKVENGSRKLDISEVALAAETLGVSLAELLGVERKGNLALAARVMATPAHDDTLAARRRVRQVLEVEASLSDAMGLPSLTRSAAGMAVLDRLRAEGLPQTVTNVAGVRAAELVRETLGLGRSAIADLPALGERHFGVSTVVWPVGKGVSGLCAHGADVALMLVSSSFPRGHQRFTGAHELAHHLLEDPREVIIEGDLYSISSPAERRANAFAAALLMPADGLRKVVAGRNVDEHVLAEVMREFNVSYRALLFRLADRPVAAITTAVRDTWLNNTPTSVLRAAGETNPAELTSPDEARRIPARLAAAAQDGYRSGRVGLGVLAALHDQDADTLYATLAAADIRPPTMQDDLADL
ncbi:MAG TPA: XRE family transcriptional regulator [Actinomycetales bacterium]|jgi:transcriptional regulator with XRE-family HTH domain